MIIDHYSISVAVVAKDLRAQVLSFFNAIIRQLTLQAIVENAGRYLVNCL